MADANRKKPPVTLTVVVLVFLAALVAFKLFYAPGLA